VERVISREEHENNREEYLNTMQRKAAMRRQHACVAEEFSTVAIRAPNVSRIFAFCANEGMTGKSIGTNLFIEKKPPPGEPLC
jgi:hypothetical protein